MKFVNGFLVGLMIVFGLLILNFAVDGFIAVEKAVKIVNNGCAK